MKNRDLLLLVLCVLLFSFVWISAVNRWMKIEVTGEIITIGVGSDTTSIHWGWLEPNDTVSYTIQLWITGNVNGTLSLNTTNWTPSNASAFITLTWNYTGFILEPNVTARIVLYLYVASDVSGITKFSFDMIITADSISD